ncbi:hypothetical protein [Solibacillus sp. FSL W8-0372]|uniref:hypothetical protein n=1 Tax=unclassified Solibacillus TaxID=2637870 RepID=UPI0030CD0EC3
MRKILIGILILTGLITLFLIYNHKQLPTEEDVFNMTDKWSLRTEEVYFVREIDGDWLTMFRNSHSITVARLEQNWLGNWKVRDEEGYESTLISTSYPPREEDEITWASSGSNGKSLSYYFGQILNPMIYRIEVETKKNVFEDALIFSPQGLRFFFIKSDEDMFLPVNIRAFSEAGELIYSTVK